jgi:hypothetical protein
MSQVFQIAMALLAATGTYCEPVTCWLGGGGAGGGHFLCGPDGG